MGAVYTSYYVLESVVVLNWQLPNILWPITLQLSNNAAVLSVMNHLSPNTDIGNAFFYFFIGPYANEVR